MWKEHFDQSLEIQEPWLQQVIGDYWVTDAEWQEAQDKFHQCMAVHGLEGTVGISGETFTNWITEEDTHILTEGLEGEEWEKAQEHGTNLSNECASGSVSVVGLLYAGPRANPTGITVEEFLRTCFQEAGLDDLAGLPDEEIRQTFSQYFHPNPKAMACFDSYQESIS